MEELVFQAKQDWEETFHTITDMVTIHDKDFNIVYANKAAEKMLSNIKTEKELTPEFMASVLDETHQPENYKTIFSAVYDLKELRIYLWPQITVGLPQTYNRSGSGLTAKL